MSEKNERKAITKNDEKFIVVIFHITEQKLEENITNESMTSLPKKEKKRYDEDCQTLVEIFLMDVVYEKVYSFLQIQFRFQNVAVFLVSFLCCDSIRLIIRAIPMENFSY